MRDESELLTINRLTSSAHRTLIKALGMLLCLLPLALWSLPSDGKSIQYVDGQLVINLSEEVTSALNNGVPLTFVCEYATLTQVLFIRWPRKTYRHSFEITHHVLSNRYLVSDGSELAPKIFSSTDDTMEYVASQALSFFDFYNSSETRYHMRLRLSIMDLPGPMRLSAYMTKAWDINTGWETWQSAQ
ncbi:hypothetical protein GCM10008090_32400 [Arenicella chitinivorans]|uniref:DUF4390 domain-containing protein n=1 Tax=Arenicella chitinivorans TaxID=1329800 RepID=A0A918VSE1_9GAMM|nr:DUF4390 domain-containing protein [Arenicella chitinivorans]GHA20071.1 hypothetical protein GCM10008090_32400 [Arenicella chitinivorans]